MKKTITLLLSIAFTLCALCACGRDSNVSGAEQALESFLYETKHADRDTLEQQFKDLDNGEDSMLSIFESLDLTLLYKNFDYKILSCEENSDTAAAKVWIKNTDFSVLMNDYAEELFEYTLENYAESSDEEELSKLVYKKSGEILSRLLSSGNYGTTEREIEVSLSNIDGKWQLDDSTLAQNILTGMDDFANSLSLF